MIYSNEAVGSLEQTFPFFLLEPLLARTSGLFLSPAQKEPPHLDKSP